MRQGAICRLMILLTLLGGAACQPDSASQKENSGTAAEENADMRSKEEAMLDFDTYALGNSVSEVERKMGRKLDLQNEVSSDTTLKDAKVSVTVMGEKALLEMNFQDNALYSYYFTADSLPQERAEALYTKLKAYYAERFGGYREEKSNEHNTPMQTALWNVGAKHIVMTYNLQRNSVSWGVQDSRP